MRKYLSLRFSFLREQVVKGFTHFEKSSHLNLPLSSFHYSETPPTPPRRMTKKEFKRNLSIKLTNVLASQNASWGNAPMGNAPTGYAPAGYAPSREAPALDMNTTYNREEMQHSYSEEAYGEEMYIAMDESEGKNCMNVRARKD